MNPMKLDVLTARIVDSTIEAVVLAENFPRATIVLQLYLPYFGRGDIYQLAKDEALRYLDVA